MDEVGIEHQTVLGCPPVESVYLAADLARTCARLAVGEHFLMPRIA
jgi:hypothetical protein